MAILDNDIRGMDGETLGRAIKADPVLRDTALVMLKTVGKRGDAKRLREIGFSAYLTAPIKSSELIDTVTAVWSAKTQGLETGLVTRHTLAESRAAASESRKSRMPISESRVLLVEDNIDNQKLAARMLEKLGSQVDVAENGKRAIEMLDASFYNLVFMDCQMPVMDGYEATSNIRKLELESSRIPIIALTAHAMKGDRERCLQAGMDDYISKPLSKKALRTVLERWLPKNETVESVEPD